MFTTAALNEMLDGVVLDRLSLHTAFSASGANEVTGGSPAYAKKAATIAAASGRARSLSTPVVFDVPTGATIAFVGVWTNAGTVFKGMFPNGGTEFDYEVDVTNNAIIDEGNNLSDDDRVAFIGGTPPTGLVEGTVYHVVSQAAGDPDTFKVSSTQGGAAIDITGIGSDTCRASKVVLEAYAAQGTHEVSTLGISL